MISVDELERELNIIRERNKKVEIDKAWEESRMRRILLMVFTYFAISFYFRAMQFNEPWISAIVPTIGFFISTLSLPFFRKMWEQYVYKK